MHSRRHRQTNRHKEQGALHSACACVCVCISDTVTYGLGGYSATKQRKQGKQQQQQKDKENAEGEAGQLHKADHVECVEPLYIICILIADKYNTKYI